MRAEKHRRRCCWMALWWSEEVSVAHANYETSLGVPTLLDRGLVDHVDGMAAIRIQAVHCP